MLALHALMGPTKLCEGHVPVNKSCVERSGLVRMGAIILLSASFAGLGGCVSSPTYGTGKPASKQLFEDVTGVLAIGPSNNREQIAYKPRPELVKPAETSALPAPQGNVVASANGVWPESPEQQRARLRADATENRDTLGWKPKIKGPENAETRSAAQYDRNPNLVLDTSETNAASRARALRKPKPARSAAQYDRNPALASAEVDPNKAREEFNRRLAATRQGNPTSRKYLSEPPIKYRAAAETAPVNDIGEDEYKKEARRKANSRKKAGKKSWRDYVPFL